MLKIGIMSIDLFRDEDWDKNFKMLKDHGFECLDYNIDGYLHLGMVTKGEPCGFFDKSTEELYEFFTPMLEASKKYNIPVTQMHAPFPLYVAGRDEDMNPYVFEATVKSFAVAQFLGCEYVVVHPINTAWKEGKQKEQERNLALYRGLMPYAKKYNVKICLENLFTTREGRCFEGPCADAYEAIWYIDKLNAEAGEERFSFCFDVGHAALANRNITEYLKMMGKRLGILHIHENNGVVDLHTLPYTQMYNSKLNVVDWKGFTDALREINYQGELCFETFRFATAVPEQLHGAFLDLISATGRYFASQIKGE